MDNFFIDIESVTGEGFGVGRADGLVVFIKAALPGDRVEAVITKAKKSHAYAKIVRIIKPSPHRIASPCAVSHICGGCQWQDCDYNAQLSFKKQIVISALQRIGGVENPPAADVIGIENPVEYRNKAIFHADGDTAGMYERKSRKVIAIDRCNIMHPAIMEVFKDFLARDAEKLLVRTGFSSGDRAAAVFSAGSWRLTHGKGFIREKIGHVLYKYGIHSFFQVNPAMTKVLYNIALSQAGLTGSETVIDAHAGVGGLGLYAADSAKSVIGVDIAPESVKDAEENAALNDIKNARFIQNKAETAIPALLKDGAKPDVIFLDPPRKGCGIALLDAIAAAEVPKIVYISCDPATLARDVKHLTAGGYILREVRPVDMFPMTGKVEVSCLFDHHKKRKKRKENPGATPCTAV